LLNLVIMVGLQVERNMVLEFYLGTMENRRRYSVAVVYGNIIIILVSIVWHRLEIRKESVVIFCGCSNHFWKTQSPSIINELLSIFL
jgi:hypothetical protein